MQCGVRGLRARSILVLQPGTYVLRGFRSSGLLPNNCETYDAYHITPRNLTLEGANAFLERETPYRSREVADGLKAIWDLLQE